MVSARCARRQDQIDLVCYAVYIIIMHINTYVIFTSDKIYLSCLLPELRSCQKHNEPIKPVPNVFSKVLDKLFVCSCRAVTPSVRIP